MSALTMVAGTSTTNRTGASGDGLLLEPVLGGDEPPSLRPRSVHAWGSPFRRSATVSAPHAMARSAHRRPAQGGAACSPAKDLRRAAPPRLEWLYTPQASQQGLGHHGALNFSSAAAINTPARA